jgi:hypothetical protein
MGELDIDMSAEAAATHLRQEVSGTARFETGRLVDWRAPAFFGAVRAVMSDMEYVAALYCGWDGENRRRIATAGKTQQFLREVVAEAAEEPGYSQYGRHLYEIYRLGTVHLRAPKVIVDNSGRCSSPALTWALMQVRRDSVAIGAREYSLRHLEPIRVAKQIAGFPTVTMLPVSINALLDDFLSACEMFAARLEADAANGDHELVDRWRSVADALASPQPNESLQW